MISKKLRVPSDKIRFLLLLSVGMLLFTPGIPVFGQSLPQSDLDALYGNWPNWVGNSGFCAIGSTGTGGPLVWPFATKSASQYFRIDQGWDIQTSAGGAVYAIAAGTIHQFAPDPGGFGNNYPTEQLDTSIGGPSDWVYYGHVHVLPSVVNQHVNAGDQIATTNVNAGDNGSAAPPGWLEIGFAQPGTDAPFDKAVSEVDMTAAGKAMQQILMNASPAQGGGGVGTPSGSSTASCACIGSLTGSASTGPPSQQQIDNAKIIIGIAKTDNVGQAGALIALMVALAESHLLILANRNVPISESNPAKQGDGGDHDSVGVFQQQPQDGWSTIATGQAALSNQAAVWQDMDPAFSAEAFLGSSPGTPNVPPALSKGLQNKAGWQSLPPWVAAQRVQGSNIGSGSNYQVEMPQAQGYLNQYWNSSPAIPLPVPISGGTPGVAPPC